MRPGRWLADAASEALGSAGEDYLRAIFKLQAAEAPVSTSAIAGVMNVSHPSATAMVKRLAARDLVRHAPYRGVRLTERGRALALELTRHHRLLELFLVERLGVSPDAAHAEADRLEHALSETLEERIAASLGDPCSDPHGDPIPSA